MAMGAVQDRYPAILNGLVSMETINQRKLNPHEE